jgi:hypothetical protein
MLPRLNLQRRLAVCLEHGFDPSPWVGEHAAATQVDLGRIRVLLEAALVSGDRADACVALFPNQTARASAEAHRKALKRGEAELGRLLEGGEA